MSLLEICKNFAILSETSMIGLPSYCKSLTDCVKFALVFALFPCNQSKISLRYVLTRLTVAHPRKLKSQCE